MRLAIDNVEKKLKLDFKSHCAQLDMTIQTAIITLMKMELEKNLIKRGGKR